MISKQAVAFEKAPQNFFAHLGFGRFQHRAKRSSKVFLVTFFSKKVTSFLP
jgi:hypothetical protein